MAQMCQWLGLSRQAHYQMVRRQQQRASQEQLILERVQAIRQRHPRLGARKLLHELGPELTAQGLQIGRDRFFDLLAQSDLLVPPLRQRRRTTWAGLWRCPNRLLDLDIIRVQQVWVADITYLETETDFCYLALLTDAFSRYIVGFDVSPSLVAEGAWRALTMAMEQATSALTGLIHHSDHGSQYTCHLYRHQLAQAGILSSMGEVGNCYDNALAERVNGILKLEYGLERVFVDVAQAVTGVEEAVWLYNHERPHLALNYRKPVDVHLNP